MLQIYDENAVSTRKKVLHPKLYNYGIQSFN